MESSTPPPPGATITAEPVPFFLSGRNGVSDACETFLRVDGPANPDRSRGLSMSSQDSGMALALCPGSGMERWSAAGGAISVAENAPSGDACRSPASEDRPLRRATPQMSSPTYLWRFGIAILPPMVDSEKDASVR